MPFEGSFLRGSLFGEGARIGEGERKQANSIKDKGGIGRSAPRCSF